MTKKPVFLCLLLVTALFLSFSGCSWFTKHNESVISPDSVESVLTSLKDQNSTLTAGGSTDEIAAMLSGHPDIPSDNISEALKFSYSNGGNTFDLTVLMFDTEDEAKALFDSLSGGTVITSDSRSGITVSQSVINMSILGESSDGLSAVGNNVYLDKEYVLIFDMNLDGADESVTGYLSSVFAGIGLDDPVTAPMDIIV